MSMNAGTEIQRLQKQFNKLKRQKELSQEDIALVDKHFVRAIEFLHSGDLEECLYECFQAEVALIIYEELA